jgi:hypothetical protein
MGYDDVEMNLAKKTPSKGTYIVELCKITLYS